MDIPVGIVIALGGGFSAYWMNRLVDRDRQNKSEKELREWIDAKYVPREVLDTKLEALNSRIGEMDGRIGRMHGENSGKLDHLLNIVSSAIGLGKRRPND